MEEIIYKYRRVIAEAAIYILITAAVLFVCFNLHNYRIKLNKKAFLDYDYIYNDVNVNDTNLGGLTKEQAVEVLEKQVQDVYSAREVNIINPLTGETYKYNFGMCGADYNFEKAAEDAYNYGREGTLEENFNKVCSLKNVSYFTHAEYETNEAVLSELVNNLAEKIEKENNIKINRQLAVTAIKQMVDYSQPGNIVLPIQN